MMRDKKRDYEELPEENLSFDLDAEEATLDPAVLEKMKNDLQWEVINHPWTIGPLVVGAGSFAYAIALAPLLGGFLVAIPIAAGSLFVGLGNAGFRLRHAGEKCAAKKSELETEANQRQEEEEKKKIERSVKFLRAELARISGRQASRTRDELEQLVDAFTIIDREMTQHNTGLLVQHMNRRVAPSVKDAYKEGLRVVLCIRELLRDDPSLDRSTLQREIEELESELKKLRSELKDRHRLIEIKEKAVALRKERFEKADLRDDMVEEFIHHVDTCEETLRSSREALIRARAEESDTGLEEALDHLKSQITMMRRVQQEFKNSQGFSLPIK